jgi:hypothetical protein
MLVSNGNVLGFASYEGRDLCWRSFRMGNVVCCEAGFNPENRTYTIRMKDEHENVTQIPVKNLEEFAAVLNKLGRQRVVLNLRGQLSETVCSGTKL